MCLLRSTFVSLPGKANGAGMPCHTAAGNPPKSNKSDWQHDGRVARLCETRLSGDTCSMHLGGIAEALQSVLRPVAQVLITFNARLRHSPAYWSFHARSSEVSHLQHAIMRYYYMCLCLSETRALTVSTALLDRVSEPLHQKLEMAKSRLAVNHPRLAHPHMRSTGRQV